MNVWPLTLPQRMEVSGYQEGTGDGRLRSPTDIGAAKVRRRFTAVPRPLTATMRMHVDQLTIFESFVRTDLMGGALPFLMPAQRGTGQWTVQFAQNMPLWAPLSGVWWRLQLDLVILP